MSLHLLGISFWKFYTTERILIFLKMYYNYVKTLKVLLKITLKCVSLTLPLYDVDVCARDSQLVINLPTDDLAP